MRNITNFSTAKSTAKKFLEELKETPTVLLPGGASVEEFFREIVSQQHALTKKEWQNIHFFWADERLVPPDDPQSNYHVSEKLLSSLPIEREHIHRFAGDAKDVEKERAMYSAALAARGTYITILGVGDDGHTASLFPGKPQVQSKKKEYLLVSDSPKPPSRRVTISPSHIRDAAAIFLLFVGDKHNAFAAFENPKISAKECPCKLCLEGSGPLYVFTKL